LCLIPGARRGSQPPDLAVAADVSVVGLQFRHSLSLLGFALVEDVLGRPLADADVARDRDLHRSQPERVSCLAPSACFHSMPLPPGFVPDPADELGPRARQHGPAAPT